MNRFKVRFPQRADSNEAAKFTSSVRILQIRKVCLYGTRLRRITPRLHWAESLAAALDNKAGFANAKEVGRSGGAPFNKSASMANRSG